MRVMIWALEENSLSFCCGAGSSDRVCVSDSGDNVEAAIEEATSFRTSVFANKAVLSCVRMRDCNVVIDKNHSCPKVQMMRGNH
jgi:hypothetical protein